MKYQKGELIKAILLLAASGAIVSAAMVAPNIPLALAPIIKTLAKQTKAKPFSIKKSLFWLKARRLVDFREKDGKITVTIRDSGKKKVLLYRLEDLKISPPKRWDRRWRMVIFDIPEKRRDARVALREKLRELGFYPLQKSCFAHPYECKNEIDFISEVFRIAPYIHYIVAQSIDGEAILKRYFSL